MSTGLRIALIGYGRMGREVHEIMRERQWPEPLIIDPRVEHAVPAARDADLAGIDMCIEFTEPGQAVENILDALRQNTPVVSGSTGWLDREEEVRNAARTTGGAVLHGNNFSIGVAVFNAVVERAALLLGRFPQYDISLHEIHHRGKKDVPSGTALMLAESILRHHGGKVRAESLSAAGPFDSETLYISAARTGSVIGEHVVTADSAADEIRLLHRAKGRRGFAEGALTAAEWLQGKSGYYTLEDMVHDIITT